MKNRNATGGFTMVEAMITMAVLAVAFTGFATLQVVGVQANYFGDRLIQASELATDLAENIERWSYTDSRLTPVSTLTGPSAMSSTAISGTWDLGSGSTTSYKAQYSDLANDPNATNPGALATNYQGLSSDVNMDGVPDFIRYWNVYAIDLSSSGTPQGLFVQIIVRWKQPGFGYRQVTASKFKRNPINVF
jgi:hypothetical protein